MKDYYQILGVSQNASQDDIKKAFHKLAHKHHPHKGGDENKFKEINEAYQILSNKEKRQQYDRFGTTEEGGFNWAWGGGPRPGIDFDFGDLGEMFEDFLGFGRTRDSRRKNLKRGKNIRVDIEIPLEATLNSIFKKVSLAKEIFCSRCQGQGVEPGTSLNKCFACGGKGEVQHVKRTFLGSFTHWGLCPECKGEGQKPEKPCNVCKGEGRIRGTEDIEIFIPAGVDSNQLIKIAGKGEAGKRGGESGDLYVRVLVKKHAIFQREGDDLFTSLPISFSQAVLGDEIEAPNLEGAKLLLKVPAGSETGKILRVVKKGIPHFSGYGRGDLYFELNIKTPKRLTKTQKMLLKRLGEEGL